MDALDSIEKRIDALSRMLGPLPDNNSADSIITGAVDGDESKVSPAVKAENLVESILSAQAMLNGAISGREQIDKVVKRAPELEKYLDPNFIEENQQVRSKEVYVNAVAGDLYTQFDQLDHIKKLEATLGAEYFRNIPAECTDKLNQINEDNGEFLQQSELIEDTLITAMKRYSEIQQNLEDSLSGMQRRLDAVADKLEKKKRADLEKSLPMPEE